MKLLQNFESPILSIAWILTFNGVVTFDGQTLRSFHLNRLESVEEEILLPQRENP